MVPKGSTFYTLLNMKVAKCVEIIYIYIIYLFYMYVCMFLCMCRTPTYFIYCFPISNVRENTGKLGSCTAQSETLYRKLGDTMLLTSSTETTPTTRQSRDHTRRRMTGASLSSTVRLTSSSNGGRDPTRSARS